MLTLAQSPSSKILYLYDDSYIGLPQPQIAAGARQKAGALYPIYESSYIKIFNSENELMKNWAVSSPPLKTMEPPLLTFVVLRCINVLQSPDQMLSLKLETLSMSTKATGKLITPE